MVKTHRFQQDRCESQGEFVMIEKKNRTVVVWLLGYWTAMKEMAMTTVRIPDDRQRGCKVRVARGEEGCDFLRTRRSEASQKGVEKESAVVVSADRRGLEERVAEEKGFLRTRSLSRQPSGVEKKRR
ncbi:hypothetical protein OIU76_010791 [Salix suchowensis]|nr:hypothetical protein OIU76_010791 [Salix suchowensis]